MHVTIVGGGPAGLATALALCPSDDTIVVIERNDYSSVRVGEYLLPQARSLFSGLGVPWADWRDAWRSCPVLRSSWGDNRHVVRDSIFDPFGDPLLLSRPIFDRRLSQLAASRGMEVFKNTRVVQTRRSDGHWELTVRQGEVTVNFITDMLVDATGRNASVGRDLGANVRKYDRLVALIGYFSTAVSQTSSFVEIETTSRGWWYCASLPQGRIVVNYYTNVDELSQSPKSALLQELEKTKHTRSRVPRRQDPTHVLVRPANSQCLSPCAGNGWLAVGDAAMSYDPLTAAGMTKAVQTGILVADAIQTGQSRGYQSQIYAEFSQYLRMRQRFYAMERRWPDSAFWRRNREHPVILPSPATHSG